MEFCLGSSKKQKKSAKPKVLVLKPNRIWYCAKFDLLYIRGAKAPLGERCCSFVGFL